MPKRAGTVNNGNQGNMHEDIEFYFEDALKIDFKNIEHEYFETIDGDRGRVEIRRHWTVNQIDWLEGKKKWKGNSAVNFSKIRRIALKLLKNDKTVKAGGKARKKVAGRDNEYPERLVIG